MGIFVPRISSVSDRLNLSRIRDHVAILYRHAMSQDSRLLDAASQKEVSKRAAVIEVLERLIKPKTTRSRRNSRN